MSGKGDGGSWPALSAFRHSVSKRVVHASFRPAFWSRNVVEKSVMVANSACSAFSFRVRRGCRKKAAGLPTTSAGREQSNEREQMTRPLGRTHHAESVRSRTTIRVKRSRERNRRVLVYRPCVCAMAASTAAESADVASDRLTVSVPPPWDSGSRSGSAAEPDDRSVGSGSSTSAIPSRSSLRARLTWTTLQGHDTQPSGYTSWH